MLKLRQAPRLEARIVRVVQIVETEHRLTGRQQVLANTCADETGAARDDDRGRQWKILRNG